MNEGPGKDEGRIDTYFVISVAYKSISSDSGLCVFQSSQAVKLLTYMRPPSMSNLSLSCRTLYVKVEAGVVTQNYGVQIKASRARFRSITALEALFFAIHSLELRSEWLPTIPIHILRIERVNMQIDRLLCTYSFHLILDILDSPILRTSQILCEDECQKTEIYGKGVRYKVSNSKNIHLDVSTRSRVVTICDVWPWINREI